MIEVLGARLRAMWTAAARATLVPLLVRCGIVLIALTAFAVAFPSAVFFGPALGPLLVVGMVPAVAPGRAGPTLAVLVAVAGWLMSTALYGEPVALWRLLGLATALYLVHILCALASSLPYDGVVGVEVIAGPILRALRVVLASAVLSILLLGIAGQGHALPQLPALLAGLAVAVGAAALLGWLLRRA